MTGWTTVPLGSLAEFVRGMTFTSDDVVPVGAAGSVACLRTRNVQTVLELSDVWAVGASFLKRQDQVLQPGDILVSSANSRKLVGKCCWVPELPWRASFGGFVSVLRARRARIEPRYLFHWFSSAPVQTTLRRFGQRTTNISNLNVERSLELQVPLPTSLGEQRRIAEVLDRAEALRTKRRDTLVQLEALPQALFFERFGDPLQNPRGFPVKPLCEVVDPQRPICYGILRPGPDQPEGIPYLRVVDMKKGEVDPSGVRKTTPAISHAFRRSSLKPGDLLVSIRGHVGRLATVPPELEGANITQDTARLAIGGTSPLFFRECLRTPSLQQWMQRHTRGAAVRGINLGDLKRMPVIVPPEREQERFALGVMALERARRSQQASLLDMDALFASLQHRAFRGEL